MKNFNISTRLFAIVCLAIVGLVVLTAFALVTQKSDLMESRQNKTRQIVETVQSLISHYGQQVDEGRLSKEDAQNAAKMAVKSIRYDKSEYIWINDYSATMIMHPIKPSLDGKDLSNFEDPTGKKIFTTFANVAKKDGAGFVDYFWAKPGFDQPVPKISYVKGYKPWGWVVGSGIYVDDVEVKFQSSMKKLGMGTLVIVILMGGSALLISRSITTPLSAITKNMQKLANGNHNIEIGYLDDKSVIGSLAKTMDVFKQLSLEREELQAQQMQAEGEAKEQRRQERMTLADDFEASVGDLIATVSTSAVGLKASAADMMANAEIATTETHNVNQSSDVASQSVQAVASATEELSASISEISAQVDRSARIATEAVEEAERTNSLVKGLSTTAEKVGDVISLITDIADQTNLLALNATIEAARAGEAGKGFAVVASEVKNLANQTAKATEEISSQIGAMQSATTSAAVAIDGISKTITKMDQVTSGIAAAVEEQGAATNEISRNAELAAVSTSEVTDSIASVSKAVEQTGTTSSEVLNSSDLMAQQADTLRKEVHNFLEKTRGA